MRSSSFFGQFLGSLDSCCISQCLKGSIILATCFNKTAPDAQNVQKDRKCKKRSETKNSAANTKFSKSINFAYLGSHRYNYIQLLSIYEHFDIRFILYK
jgi:hypothetical protein